MTAAVRDAYPLGRLQAGMLYHADLAAGEGTYQDVHSFCLRGRFDEAAVRECLRVLATRHDILRTSFDVARFSEPLQLVHADVEIPLEVVRQPPVPPERHRAWFERWLESERTRPFEPTAAPLLRVFVHLVRPDTFWVTLIFAHAILDGWSVHTLVRQFVEGYAALLDGRRPPGGAPRTRYRDFVALERATIADPRAVGFWADVLRGFPEPTLLAGGPAAAGAATPAGGVAPAGGVVRVRGTIPAATVRAVARVADALGVRPRSVFLAAHLRVVAGLTGAGEAITGVVVNGRPEQTDAEDVLGLFLNTLPVPARLVGRDWRSIVRDVFAAEVALLEYRRFPLEELQRMAGRSRLFDTAFNYNDFRTHSGLADGPAIRLVDTHVAEATDFALYASFSRDQQDDAVHVTVAVREGAVDAHLVEHLPSAYRRTIEAICRDPGGGPGDVNLLQPGAGNPLLSVVNDTARAGPDAVGLHDAFSAWARRTPQRTAVVCGARHVSYRELDRWSDSLAARLGDCGVGPGVLVGVCAGRSAALVAGLLAVLKAGGAYVPMDPTYPSERLGYMVADAGVRLVLTGTDGPTSFGRDVATLPLDADAGRSGSARSGASPSGSARSGASPSGAVTPSITGEDLAYVIYTSGSTGRPKGVMVSHRAILNLLGGMADVLGLTPDDTWLAVTTICFDIAALEIFGPITTGGTCVLADESSTADGQALARLAWAHDATVLQATPATWRLLLAAGWPGSFRLRALCGGEAFPPDLAARLVTRTGAVWNVYGPTETTVWSLAARVDWADASAGTIPIGRPIANTRVHVVDPFGQPVPVGVPGELLIGGSGVARGYLNRPALTAERFQPDPFGPSGGIVYRTGDIVRWRPDGALDFLGRADHQVKVRGFRIELGEVEKALTAQPGVRAAVVTTREDGPGERRLIGYLVPDGGDVSVAEVRAALRRTLPEYMVPSLLVPLEALPLTDNGKIDRAALPVPDGGREQSAAPFEAPRDDLERSLAEAWGRVLRLPTERIGVHDSFFDLGGDSLKAFTVVSQLRQRLAVDLPLAAFLADPTIAGLSGSVRSGHAASPAPVLITLLDDPPYVPELVLVHPLGGHVFAYQLLAARLRGRIRLTVVRARGVERGETPYRSIREMATHYLAELRRDRPDGDYHLGGWCLGGAIAHEMAVQLREAGTPAAGLIAISSSALDEGLKGLADDHLALATFAVTGHRLDGAGEDGLEEATEQLAADRRAALATLAGLRALDEDSQLERLVSLASTTEALRPDITSVTDARTLMRIYRAHQHALQDHRPRPYLDEMHLIKPSRCHLPDTPAGDLGWGPVTGALRVHPVAGTHYSILEEPAVEELADALVALVAPDPVSSAGVGRAAAGPSQ